MRLVFFAHLAFIAADILALAAGLSLRYFLPRAVECYIHDKRLYGGPQVGVSVLTRPEKDET